MKDLLQIPELIPENVWGILDTFDESKSAYKECERLQGELKEIGYTVDYDLSGNLIDLHKIEEIMEDFNNYKTLHEFQYPDEPLKSWVDADNYSNVYKEDWNCLMEIVDKIESLTVGENNSFNVTIGATNYCVIQDSNGDIYDSTEDCGDNKLMTTYMACVSFVKWYNQNKRGI